MKKLILTILLFSVLPLSSFCQQFSLKNLIAIYKKDVEGINEHLKSEGWENLGKWEEKGNTVSSLNWAFDYNPTSKTSTDWLSFLYDNGEYFCVTYSFQEASVDYIEEGVKALKLKKVSSGILGNGVLYSEFAGTDYYLRIVIKPKEEGAEGFRYKVGVISKNYSPKVLKK